MDLTSADKIVAYFAAINCTFYTLVRPFAESASFRND